MRIRIPFLQEARRVSDRLTEVWGVSNHTSWRLKAPQENRGQPAATAARSGMRTWARSFLRDLGLVTRGSTLSPDQIREGHLRAYARRALLLTDGLTDPEKIRRRKEEVLEANGDDITVEELEKFIDTHRDQLGIEGQLQAQRAAMAGDARLPNIDPSNTSERNRHLQYEPHA